MSPLVIVGITLLTTVLGDVSHVLKGEAQPPQTADPQDINNAFDSKDPKDFWWMRDDSPLKASYDYFKKCAATGKCPKKQEVQFNDEEEEGNEPIDVKSNIFLNGNFASAKSDSSSSSSSSGAPQGFHSGAKIDLSNNPFLQGSFAHAGSASCAGSDRSCVPKSSCVNGYTATSAPKDHKTECGENEICCRFLGSKSSIADHINQLLFTPGKSKVTGKDGLTPEQVQIIHSGQQGLRSQINLIGEFSGSSTVKPVRDLSAAANSPVFSSTPDYSNDHIGDEVRISNLEGLDYLPPVTSPTTPPSPTCPPGQYVGSFGRCEPTRKPCPTGTRPTPSGGCEVIKCPPGQQQGPYGGCITITPPRPPVVPPQPPISPPQRPECGPGQRLGLNGQCIQICLFGERPTPLGGCEPTTTPAAPPPPPLYCPSGTRVGSNGECITICRAGERPTPSGGCAPIITTPSPPPTTPYCPSGTRKGPNGLCIQVCGPGERPTPLGGCEPTTTPAPPPPPPDTPLYCPSGTRKGPNGLCIQVCGPGERPTPLGRCEPTTTPAPPPPPPPYTPLYCPSGTRVGSNGECITICRAGERPTPSGGCAPIITTPSPPPPVPPIYCPSGTRVGPNGECITVCRAGERPTPSGRCEVPPRCPPGYTTGPTGNCILPPPPPPRPCPPGQKRGPYGCEPIESCRPGQRLGSNGQCVPIEQPPPVITPGPYCPSGQRRGPNGACVPIDVTCPAGQKLGPIGNCIPISPPGPRPQCPPGSLSTASGCQPPSCPSGTSISPSGTCVRVPTTPSGYLPPKTPGYNYPKGEPPFTDGTIDDTLITDKEFAPGSNVPISVSPNDINRTNRPPPRTQPPRVQPRPGVNETIPEELIPVGCAAALKCVQEIYCTADGFVSPVPVVLTKEQELLRAPTTVCRDLGSGTLGKCCRDRDYQDPWPSANLVNGVDDGKYAEDDSIGQYKAEYNRITRSSRLRRSRRDVGECGVRNLNSSPKGLIPIDANFAEITWQAMILRASNRSLLCGGVIVRRNAVLTAAHCVEGIATSDVLIKGGEWKLGIDEEPLPFQIVKVAAILRHPDFQPGSLQNDMALLVLEENLRFAKNIGQICLPEPNKIPTQNCIATGWGKRILQLHARNALMHYIGINIMEAKQCQEVLGQYFQQSLPNYNTNTLCGFSDVDQCKVDYGSALACADESGRYTLSGIYSWDTGCRQQGQVGGYVAPDVDWIETVLATPLKQLKRLDRVYNTAK